MITVDNPIQDARTGARHYEVWTDCEGGYLDGRCLGCDKSLEEALLQAYSELSCDLKLVEKRLNELRAGEQP